MITREQAVAFALFAMKQTGIHDSQIHDVIEQMLLEMDRMDTQRLLRQT